MARQVYRIEQFHGGINSDSHARDIAENEVVSAYNADLSKLGQFKLLPLAGIYGSSPTVGSNTSYTIAPAYGLFHFKSDFERDGDLAKTNFYALADANTYTIDIRDGSNSYASRINWNSADLGTLKAVYYYADGALRISDANFSANTFNKWYGCVSDKDGDDLILFKNASTTQTISKGFVHGASKIYKPSASYFDIGGSIPSVSNTHAPTLPVDAKDITANGASGTMTVEVTEDTLYDANVTTLHTAEITFGALDEGEEEGTTTTYRVELKAGKASSVSGDTVSWATGYPKTSTIVTKGNVGAKTFEVDLGQNTMTNGSSQKWAVQAVATVINGVNANLTVSILTGGVKFVRKTQGEPAQASAGINNFHVGLIYGADDDAYGWDGEWQVGTSLLFDKKPHQQESLITVLRNNSDTATNFYSITEETDAPIMTVYVKYSSSWSDRIVGAKVYMRKRDSGEWHPQATLDFIEGTMQSYSSGDITNCRYDITNTQYIFRLNRDNLLSPDLTSTFRVESGYDENEEAITALFKTATVANRVAYIGNVKVLKEDGTEEILSDTILKSIPGKFDIFPLSNRIDVAVNDGEEITALLAYGNRLLQYKENTLYLVNISNYGSEYLEGKYEFMGAKIPSAVTMTDFGVAWVNKFGCFFFDGRTAPKNLLIKQGERKISESDWTSFVNDDSMITYSPKDKKLVVISTASSSNIVNYVYDFITGSWMKGDNRVATNITNPIVDHAGDLVWGDDNSASGFSGFAKWTGLPHGHSTFDLKTKEMTFNNPASLKNIYKVYVTYKSTGGGTATNVKLLYGTNSATPTSTFATNADGSYNVSSGFGSSATFTTVELIPSSSIKNIRSFQLAFAHVASPVDSAFEVTDVTVVYRTKRQR
ncbi:MAG: hypothetical protein CBB96_07610 [Gammaproteobacteria bacterium TMED36]|nr:MAG: hypothetical protein CBB96_07610 [Gammaproteobacteria bacterium TMED36]|tara:strand:- start:4231 stop:6876 length:2646 start_codon:yes stop_codon:yes gene_type:complete